MKKILLLAILIFNIILCYSREFNKINYFSDTIDSKQNKWVFGGSLGASFGDISSIVINPSVGYKLTDWLITGVDVGYTYVSNKGYSKSNLFNVGGYLQPIYNNIFGIIKYDYYFGEVKYDSNLLNNKSYDINENALWLGGGYRTRIGNNVSINFGIQYNVLYNKNSSIFGNSWQPIIGVSAGL